MSGLGNQLLRRKPIIFQHRHHEGEELKRNLGTFQLMMFGVGATIGTGIFFVLSESIPLAGPAVILSFLLAAIAAGLAALCYAELASSIPVSGSSYSFTYHALGEGAAILVSRLLPEITEDDWYNALLTAQDYLLSLGITGWQDAIVGRYEGEADPLTAYLRAVKAGTLLASVTGALWWDRHRGLEQLGELLDQRTTGQAGTFRATSVKMMLDGVAENHTAAMLEPYLDGDGCSTGKAGLDFIDPRELLTFVAALDREGFQVHFHALGDRAVRNALDAVEEARRVNGPGGPRHHLAHLQVIHPDDVPRFARVSATANIQPLWATHEPQMDELTIPFLGERRAGWQYPFRSLEAAGAAMCAGSDWPVSSPNPLWGAHVAVNRQLPARAGGQGGDPFLPQQAIGLTSILTAYTSGSARVNGVGTEAGSIAEGYNADLAVVTADLAHIPAGDICHEEVI